MRTSARALKSESPSEIAIGVFECGNDAPVQILRAPAPRNFSAEHLLDLADYMARGFNAALAYLENGSHDDVPSLADFVPSRRGRPSDDDSEREGREGAKLRKEGHTFGQIARLVCRNRNKPAHRCKKDCTDRIRQAVEQYETQEYLRGLQSSQ